VVIGVGRADDRAFAPRDDEKDPLALAEDNRIGKRKKSAVDDEVNALRQAELYRAVTQPLGLWSGRVHDRMRENRKSRTGKHVLRGANPLIGSLLGLVKPDMVDHGGAVGAG